MTRCSSKSPGLTVFKSLLMIFHPVKSKSHNTGSHFFKADGARKEKKKVDHDRIENFPRCFGNSALPWLRSLQHFHANNISSVHFSIVLWRYTDPSKCINKIHIVAFDTKTMFTRQIRASFLLDCNSFLCSLRSQSHICAVPSILLLVVLQGLWFLLIKTRPRKYRWRQILTSGEYH